MQSIFCDITNIIHFFHENQIDKLVYKVSHLNREIPRSGLFLPRLETMKQPSKIFIQAQFPMA